MKLMTMKQFLQNPSGSYSSSFARRDLIIANMEDRFAKLYKNRKKDFKSIIFRNKNDFFFYIQTPSEKYDNLIYDVVIQFIPVDMNCVSSTTIDKYAVKVFSNSLNFTYTYAYWYNQEDLLIKELKDKLSPKSLSDKPVIKNDNGIIGFEKSVYWALLYIKYNELTKKSNIMKSINLQTNMKKIKSQIKSSNSKIIEYNIIKKANGDKNKSAGKKKNMANEPFKF